jgi:hypothetical protein
MIEEICDLNWESLTKDDLTSVAIIYYYFSVQFRENLKAACEVYPKDEKLRQLEKAECYTDNLSPWPGVADVGEKMDHDEFMRRLLALSPIHDTHRDALDTMGQQYLQTVRGMELEARAQSIAAYEDGGLERVFRAMLNCGNWESPALQAFKHFLDRHIGFDSDAEFGHGALSRHIKPNDDEVLPFWLEFKRILIGAAPRLLS